MTATLPDVDLEALVGDLDERCKWRIYDAQCGRPADVLLHIVCPGGEDQRYPTCHPCADHIKRHEHRSDCIKHKLPLRIEVIS